MECMDSLPYFLRTEASPYRLAETFSEDEEELNFPNIVRPLARQSCEASPHKHNLAVSSRNGHGLLAFCSSPRSIEKRVDDERPFGQKANLPSERRYPAAIPPAHTPGEQALDEVAVVHGPLNIPLSMYHQENRLELPASYFKKDTAGSAVEMDKWENEMYSFREKTQRNKGENVDFQWLHYPTHRMRTMNEANEYKTVPQIIENMEREVSMIPREEWKECLDSSFSLPFQVGSSADAVDLPPTFHSPRLTKPRQDRKCPVASSVEWEIQCSPLCPQTKTAITAPAYVSPSPYSGDTELHITGAVSISPKNDTVQETYWPSSERNSRASDRSASKAVPGLTSSFSSIQKYTKIELPTSLNCSPEQSSEASPGFAALSKMDASDKLGRRGGHHGEGPGMRLTKKKHRNLKCSDLFRSPMSSISSTSWNSLAGGGSGSPSGALRPMCQDTVIIEELSGPEALAVFRMRNVLQSFGDTHESRLPSSRCHRMFLTKEEANQIHLLRKLKQDQQQQQLARRGISKGGRPSSSAKTARVFCGGKMHRNED